MRSLISEARALQVSRDDLRRAAQEAPEKVDGLRVGDKVWSPKGERFKDVSIGRDKNGLYVFTHRVRSKSYPSRDKIPKRRIAFVRSTG